MEKCEFTIFMFHSFAISRIKNISIFFFSFSLYSSREQEIRLMFCVRLFLNLSINEFRLIGTNLSFTIREHNIFYFLFFSSFNGINTNISVDWSNVNSHCLQNDCFEFNWLSIYLKWCLSNCDCKKLNIEFRFSISSSMLIQQNHSQISNIRL